MDESSLDELENPFLNDDPYDELTENDSNNINRHNNISLLDDNIFHNESIDGSDPNINSNTVYHSFKPSKQKKSGFFGDQTSLRSSPLNNNNSFNYNNNNNNNSFNNGLISNNNNITNKDINGFSFNHATDAIYNNNNSYLNVTSINDQGNSNNNGFSDDERPQTDFAPRRGALDLNPYNIMHIFRIRYLFLLFSFLSFVSILVYYISLRIPEIFVQDLEISSLSFKKINSSTNISVTLQGTLYVTNDNFLPIIIDDIYINLYFPTPKIATEPSLTFHESSQNSILLSQEMISKKKSHFPSVSPTIPSISPTILTHSPTKSTDAPTNSTLAPTKPTQSPTIPTESPTSQTKPPTSQTKAPTLATDNPTLVTIEPTQNPTFTPTLRPTPKDYNHIYITTLHFEWNRVQNEKISDQKYPFKTSIDSPINSTIYNEFYDYLNNTCSGNLPYQLQLKIYPTYIYCNVRHQMKFYASLQSYQGQPCSS